MSKKGAQKTSGNLINPAQINQGFAMATLAMQSEDWKGAIEICKRLLRYLPKNSKLRAEALTYQATAYGMQQEFTLAYQTLSEALTITPEDGLLWYNRGVTDRFLSLAGLSVRDLEKAVVLTQEPDLLRKFKSELKFSQKIAQSELSSRPKGFTLDQLIEQQEYFYRGNALMLQRKWSEAELAFRSAIQMSDGLPNPQGNLGNCLMMQGRLDEAEAALKRALGIDKKYDLARQNLKVLEGVRNGDPLPTLQMNEPFKGKTKVSMDIYRE